jgi:hypothetical protein
MAEGKSLAANCLGGEKRSPWYNCGNWQLDAFTQGCAPSRQAETPSQGPVCVRPDRLDKSEKEARASAPSNVPRPVPQGSEQVQHKVVSIRPKLSYDERHPLGLVARHKGNVTAQAVQLGDDDRPLILRASASATANTGLRSRASLPCPSRPQHARPRSRNTQAR